MRKNSVRKWIHAIIDLLPLLVIPIFAINIINRSPEPISVEAQNYNIYIQNQLLNVSDINQNITRVNSYTFEVSSSVTTWQTVTFNCKIENGHYYLCHYESSTNDFHIGSKGDLPYVNTTQLFNGYKSIRIGTGAVNSGIDIKNDYQNNQSTTFMVNVIDLTLWFGEGNEPTSLADLPSYFDNFYEYNLGSKFIDSSTTITYNDTDIGSQFVYSIYNTTDKYFNMGNIFGIEGFYYWLNTNLFNGGAPLMIKTIWTIIVYEFIMDLMFLFYDIFMFLIDWIKALLGRAIDKTSGGAC